MSFTNYAKNDLVYIRNIGYGTIVQCGELNVFSQRNQSAPLKKESIIFDPDLFNSETDSNQSKKSQSEEAKALLEKITNKDEPLLVTAMIPSEEKETTTETVTAEQPTEQKTAQDPTVSKK